MAARKRSRKAGEKAGTLVPQKHGGAIHQGTPGRIVPGPGRPPSAVRMRARDSFYDRIPILEEIADNTKDASNEQRISAIDKLGKYGLSGSVSADDVRERLKATLQEIRSALPEDQAQMLVERIKPHWMAA